MRFYALLAITLLLTACSSSSKEYQLENVHVIKGDEVQELIKQKQYSAIYFWTTWCAPCRSTLKKYIQPILDTTDREDFQMLVVALSKDPEKVQEIVNNANITQDVYVVNDYSFDNALADKIKMNSIISDIDDELGFLNRVPVVLVVDKTGKVYGDEQHVSDILDFLNGKLVQ